MPEKLHNRTVFSLLEVSLSIQKTLTERYSSSFWIKAEMNRLNHYPQSGHCYPDLVEKTEGKVVAEMKSTIWRDDFQRINNQFLKVLREPLKDGIKILFCARINYSPQYGLNLNIIDIDPSWSLGELEKEKQETIEKIKKEGLFDVNRTLTLPLLPQRIAVISVQTSKGYADFCKVIENNEWGYKFFQMLFPALLQSENAVASIAGQLEKIRKVKEHFDVVAIIRGGGGDVGLSCYNNYELSRAICLFPLPVITGIGHSTNETVAEMVAFRNAITPTELADFLIQKFHNFAVPVQKARDTVTEKFKRMVQDEKLKILNTVRYFKSVTVSMLDQRNNEISKDINAIKQQSKYWLQMKRERNIHQNIIRVKNGSRQILSLRRQGLESTGINLPSGVSAMISSNINQIRGIEKNIELLDPVNILNRGYSITLAEGRVLKSIGDTAEGMVLKTLLADGNIISITKTVNKTENHEQGAKLH